MTRVYAKILLWLLAALVVSLAAFFYISTTVAFRSAGPGGPMHGMHRFQTEEAQQAYESGGEEGLRHYLARLERFFPDPHYLTTASGRDVLTGEDRSDLLAQIRSAGDRPVRRGEFGIVGSPSADGKYYFVAVVRPPVSRWNFLPYFGLVLVGVAGLLWLLSTSLVAPLRQLSGVVSRFGRGELSVRARLSRNDEFGDLSRAFDEMAERIETLLNAERRLLQDISHELRSPLARLKFALELSRTAADREAALARVEKEVDRLTELVISLVEMTRMEGDPTARELVDVRLDLLLEEVLGDCEMEATARQCTLARSYDGAVHIRGDAELMRRAVENVVRNAIRYAPAGSAVEVSLRAEDANAVVQVRDRGPGVPEEALERIFQPFYRVDDSRTGATGGVGLGLAIALRAVHVHHGTLTAENAQPGLRVRLSVPLANGAPG